MWMSSARALTIPLAKSHRAEEAHDCRRHVALRLLRLPRQVVVLHQLQVEEAPLVPRLGPEGSGLAPYAHQNVRPAAYFVTPTDTQMLAQLRFLKSKMTS